MENFRIRNLSDTPVEKIHEAFCDAFSEYEVKLDMPFERLVEMIKIRDLNPGFSVGCFYGELLVGFILIGYREINGQKVCYDGGTGVTKAYQRKGIGELMLKELLVRLNEKKVSRFVLEVLENNTPAIKLYEKHGFTKTRKLECFEITKNELRPLPGLGFEVTVINPATLIQNEEMYRLFLPTWQNEIQSVLNVSEN